MSVESPSRAATLLALIAVVIVSGARVEAQQERADSAPSVNRWVEIDTFTIYSRYHLVENNADLVTSNTSQYKAALRAHVNLDSRKRLTVHAGAFTGSTFTSAWNSLGVGSGHFDTRHHYLKQLYVAAVPHAGWEVQYGSLYVSRGEEDEITSYDDDGYLVGARVRAKLPRALGVDEVVVTRGEIGPYNEPNAFDRWQAPSRANYEQVLIAKRFNARVAGSIEYQTQSGVDTLHAGLTLRLPDAALVQTVRYEQYRRTTSHAAGGFAVWADRLMAKRVRVQGGYATVDQFFGGWNSSRMQSGRRVFGAAQAPLARGFTLQVYGTQALSADYPIPIKRRLDIAVNYDVLTALRHTPWF
jgi:hypothetical protein